MAVRRSLRRIVVRRSLRRMVVRRIESAADGGAPESAMEAGAGHGSKLTASAYDKLTALSYGANATGKRIRKRKKIQ